MGCDMVVALGSATVNGITLFGKNLHMPSGDSLVLHRNPGKSHCPGETVLRGNVELPQWRETYTVLACQQADDWGYLHGLNEHQVAMSSAAWQSKLGKTKTGLTGPDLVRLALERCHSARQAIELVTDLVARHGQTGDPLQEDNIFLVADAQEAYVLEAAGSYWAWTECRDRRAVSNVGLVRQDWQRLSPGLAEHAIAQGWWPDDGSKLDFGCLSVNALSEPSALRRWGRAALLLEQQAGHLDASLLRRLLGDHYERTPFEFDPAEPGDGPAPLCQHGPEAGTTASFLTQLSAKSMPLAWCSFGPPCLSVYVPLFLDGDLPEAYQHAEPDSLWHPYKLTALVSQQPRRWASWRNAVTQLQARFDQETDEFLAEARALKTAGDQKSLHRQATLFMQNHMEQLEAAYQRLYIPGPRRPVYAPVAGVEG